MYIITDSNGKVVDKASKEKSLNRGYLLAGAKKGSDSDLVSSGYTKIEITKNIDIRIEDTYKGKVLSKNIKHRAIMELPGVENEVIFNTVMSKQAEELQYTDLKNDFDTKITKFKSRRMELIGIIG